MDRETGEVLPIEIEKINDYVGKEFHLTVFGKNFHKDQKKILQNSKERNKYKLKNLLSKNKKIKYLFNGTEGLLSEIYKIKPSSIRGYYWGSANKITFENETPVNSIIKNEVGQNYLFIPKEIKYNGKLVLTGTIQEQNKSNNKLSEPLENKVKVTLREIPKDKQLIPLGRF